ncbi:MAG: hypothetical protein ABJB74_11805 [Gemmatimonas sp.]
MNLLPGLFFLLWAAAPDLQARLSAARLAPNVIAVSHVAFNADSVATSNGAFGETTNTVSVSTLNAASVADSTVIREQIEKKTEDFLEDWKKVWMKSDEALAIQLLSSAGKLVKLPNPTSALFGGRSGFTHCHPDPSQIRILGAANQITTQRGIASIRPNYEALNWNYQFFAKCATWLLGPIAGDESERIDNGFLPQFHKGVEEKRARLNTALEQAQQQLPGDPWIAGQRVHFLIDAGQNKEAIQSAAQCISGKWWCSTIAGDAYYRANQIMSADAAFTVAIEALQGKQRCEWTDITLLLTTGAFTDGARGNYHDQSCEQRLLSEDKFWWLSDPLLSEEGNDRRVEHFARKTLVLLHKAIRKDEHYDWRPDHNGEVINELLIRYGWPTASVWGGAALDIEHANFVSPTKTDLKVRMFEPRMGPYSTMEYSRGRVHLSPKWDVLKAVAKAEPDDWQLYAPLSRRGDSPGR